MSFWSYFIKKFQLKKENGMSNKVYVGNLSWSAGDDDLATAFGQFGTITEIKIVFDRDTGRSKGFGFITFETADQADTAVEAMNGKEILGRAIKTNIAIEQPRRTGGRGFTRDRQDTRRY